MRLTELAAAPDPRGHRVVLTWRAADPATAPGARVVRRARAFPQTAEPAVPAAGVVVADTDGTGSTAVGELGDGWLQVIDTGLVEGMHYYQVFPYAGTPAVYDPDPGNRVACAATAPFGFAAKLAALLPAVYHRFDAATPAASPDPAVAAAVGPGHREHGQLRRYLELPGAELDRLYSDIRSLADLTDLERIDGRLLPLLAAWIGWRTDYSLGYDEQRAEIRQAPALYQTVGTVPATVAATRRISTWPARVKEYVDNIAITNRPERRTLWLLQRDGAGFDAGQQPLSIDSSPHGRPAVVPGVEGATALVYHAAVDRGHEIRWKPRTAGQWLPSEPVVVPQEPHATEVCRDPAAARQGEVTWVFWSVYDPVMAVWRIDLRRHQGGVWDPVRTFRSGPADTTGRRGPAATVDHDGALWLFWQELVAGAWRARHARFATDPWQPEPVAGVDLPGAGGQPLGADAGLSIVARAPQAGDPVAQFRRLVVLWAERTAVPGAPEQSRWRVVARCKDGSDPADLSDWTPSVTLPGADPLRHDRDPAALVDSGGVVRVMLASTRPGGWAVHRARLDLDPVAFSTPQPMTDQPCSHRWPVPLSLTGSGDLDAVCVRSNRGFEHPVAHGDAATTDRRWSGSTTVRSSDAAAIALRDSYPDHLTYTYDTGRADPDRYARDTVGLFADSGTATPAEVEVTAERLRRALAEFLPATDRAVLAAPGAP